jgi:Flp pilus assembly protein TadD
MVLIVLVVLSVRTFVRSFAYRDEPTLVSKDIQVSQEDYNLENGMSVLLLNRGKFNEAEFYAKESIQHNPGWNNYNTLGTVYLKLKEYDKAKQAYNKALTFSQNYKTYQNLASITLLTGKSEENIASVKSSIQKFPFDSTLWLYLAILEYKAKNISDAKNAATKAVTYNATQDLQIMTIASTILNQKPLNISYK